jgi:hypothetical protein
MSELKTKPNKASVSQFINSIEDHQKKADCKKLLKLMKELTGASPKMWGDSIVGFGNFTYTYASGKTGEWFLSGFSPRKQNLTLYIMSGFDKLAGELDKLGKHRTGKGCLYFKKLSDVDEQVLRQLISKSVARLTKS